MFFFAYRQLNGGGAGISFGPNNPEDVCDAFLHPLRNTAGAWDRLAPQESLLHTESSKSAQRAGRQRAGKRQDSAQGRMRGSSQRRHGEKSSDGVVDALETNFS